MTGSTRVPAADDTGIGPRPAVSVITTFHDEERFLAEAIESVIAQTRADWELLLVDDGSTDRSSAVAREYASRRPGQIRYIEHPGHENRGKSASRNLGIAHARGEYLAFLDGDDIYLPRRLDRHVQVLDSLPDVAMVQSDVVHWLSWQPPDARNEDDYVRPCVCFTDRVLRAPLGLWMVVAVPELYPGICSLTVRRAVVTELGAFEPRFRSVFEDQVFLTKVCASRTVYVIEDYLAAYRIHPRSTMERLRSTAHVSGGVWQTERGEFAAWRLRYLRSLQDPTGLLAPIIKEAEAAQVTGIAGPLGQALSTTKAWAKRILERTLPQAAYRHLLHRRRCGANRRTLDAYRRLSERAMPAAESCR